MRKKIEIYIFKVVYVLLMVFGTIMLIYPFFSFLLNSFLDFDTMMSIWIVDIIISVVSAFIVVFMPAFTSKDFDKWYREWRSSKPEIYDLKHSNCEELNNIIHSAIKDYGLEKVHKKSLGKDALMEIFAKKKKNIISGLFADVLIVVKAPKVTNEMNESVEKFEEAFIEEYCYDEDNGYRARVITLIKLYVFDEYTDDFDYIVDGIDNFCNQLNFCTGIDKSNKKIYVSKLRKDAFYYFGWKRINKIFKKYIAKLNGEKIK